jgi:hypothetical protein
MDSVIGHIGRYADIDTRLALRVPPRKLPVTNFVPRPVPPVSWRYWPEQQTAVFLNVYPDEFEFEIHKGLYRRDDGSWYYNQKNRIWTLWKRNDEYDVREMIDVEPELYFFWGSEPDIHG